MTTKKLFLLPFLALLALATAVPGASAAPTPLNLEFLGHTPAGGEGTAEIATFDPDTQRVFATDAETNQLDVFDFSDPTAPELLFEVDLAPYGDGPNSVVYSSRYGGFVAVAVEAGDVGASGSVEVFDVDGNHLASFPAGSLPDMITTADHDHYLLVANEGEPASDGSVDPEGSVTVIDIRGGLKHAKVRTADFHGVPMEGPVRVFTPGSTVAQDLEPEYITSEGNRAWVSLQEANAIAVLDIKRARFEVVRSLGFKNHGLPGNGLDANDKDKAPTIKPHANVFGMYQPDALSAFTVRVRTPRGLRNETFIATANEGDARDYDFFSEESRVNGLALDSSVFPAGTAADAALGRLTVTTTLGDANKDGKYEQLYAFGGRSMSLLNADGQVVFDTGDQLEQLSASLDLANYGKDNAPSAIDNRSDNKGPEPEAVTTGEVEGHTYAFVGAERSGMIYAYDLSSDPGTAEFAGWINTRDGDLGPEGIEFVGEDDSPTGEPMLLVTYEITGTVAAYGVTG